MKGTSTTSPDVRPAFTLALGFTVSSTLVFAATAALGTGLFGALRGGPWAWVAAAGVCAVLFAADAHLFGWRTPMWRRQTPKAFAQRFRAPTTTLLWGLDAGLVVTTFRVTSLSWAALFVTFAGLVPWWAGVVYALGFVLPELGFDLLVPRRTDPTGATDPEPTWVLEKLALARPKLRWLGLITLAAATGWAALGALAS